MRVIKALGAFIISMVAYVAISSVPGFLFAALGAAVGGGKVGAVALVYMPAALLALGWAHGKRIFRMHLAAIAVIGFEAWRFQAFFDPEYHVGTLQKEWPYHVSMVAVLVFGICALTAAIRNAKLIWKGQEVGLTIPFYGQISVGKQDAPA